VDFLDDPEEMTPEERLHEVAAILAHGYLRLRRSELAPENAPSEPADKPLDYSRRPKRPLARRLTGAETEGAR